MNFLLLQFLPLNYRMLFLIELTLIYLYLFLYIYNKNQHSNFEEDKLFLEILYQFLYMDMLLYILLYALFLIRNYLRKLRLLNTFWILLLFFFLDLI